MILYIGRQENMPNILCNKWPYFRYVDFGPPKFPMQCLSICLLPSPPTHDPNPFLVALAISNTNGCLSINPQMVEFKIDLLPFSCPWNFFSCLPDIPAFDKVGVWCNHVVKSRQIKLHFRENELDVWKDLKWAQMQFT